MEGGIYEHWIRETLRANNLAIKMGLVEFVDDDEEDSRHQSFKALKARNFFGLLMILASGCLFSAIALQIEKCFARKIERNALGRKVFVKTRQENSSRKFVKSRSVL